MNLVVVSEGPVIRSDAFYGALDNMGYHGNLLLLVDGTPGLKGSHRAVRGYAKFNQVPMVRETNPSKLGDYHVDVLLYINKPADKEHAPLARRWRTWATENGVRIVDIKVGLED